MHGVCRPARTRSCASWRRAWWRGRTLPPALGTRPNTTFGRCAAPVRERNAHKNAARTSSTGACGSAAERARAGHQTSRRPGFRKLPAQHTRNTRKPGSLSPHLVYIAADSSITTMAAPLMVMSCRVPAPMIVGGRWSSRSALRKDFGRPLPRENPRLAGNARLQMCAYS